MNATSWPKTVTQQLLPLPAVAPRVRGKIKGALQESALVISECFFWTLVLILAGLLWLGSGLLRSIENLLNPPRPISSSGSGGKATAGALISINLVIVLAVITAGVGALAYEWHHAQAVKVQQRSLVLHHYKTGAGKPAAAP